MNRLALILTAVTVAICFGVALYGRHLADFYMTQGVEMTHHDIVLIAFSGFWHRFWWVAIFALYTLYSICVIVWGLFRYAFSDHSDA